MFPAAATAAMEQKTITYDPELLKKWRLRLVQKEWLEKYPGTFDKEDLRIATGPQASFHFGEWFVARKYAARGRRVLVEKYFAAKTHKRKYEALSRFFTPEELKFLTRSQHQPPDLFVYGAGKQPVFVEIKRDGDSFRRDSQKTFFEEIEKRLGIKVIVYYLKPATAKGRDRFNKLND